MTAFKGLRQDGKYRRRLDFATTEKILNKSLEDLDLRHKNNLTIFMYDLNKKQSKL